VIIYFHDIKLRFLNINGGGEWQSHGIRLTEVVLHVVPHIANLKLYHDAVCVFQNALYHYNVNWMEVVEA